MRMRIKRRMMMSWMRMRMKKWGGPRIPRRQGGGETLSMRMRMVKKCSGKTMHCNVKEIDKPKAKKPGR